MKILMLNYEFPPIGGGAGVVTYDLSRELVRLDHEVTVVTMAFKSLPRKETIEGIKIYRIPSLRSRKNISFLPEMFLYLLFAIPFLLKITSRKKFDVVHAHFIVPTGMLAYLLYKLKNLPYLITAHGSDVPRHNPKRFKFQHRLIGPLFMIIIKNAKRIIAPSTYLKNLINSVSRVGSDNIKVIPNGISLDKFKFDPSVKEKKILSVGRIYRFKGFQYLIQTLKGADIDWEVNIVGDGPYKEEVKRTVKAYGLKNVRFSGWLDRNSLEFKNLYENSLIFVLPSLRENLSIALLEAMGAGLAIISTDVADCSKVLNGCGILVAPGKPKEIEEALLTLVNNVNYALTMGEKARKRVKTEYSWGRITKQYVAAYNSVMEK